jgi:hypothetical protein
VATLSGAGVAWQQVQTNLPAGDYTLNWTYSKGLVDSPNGIPFLDAAWVDEVALASSAIPEPVLGIELTAGKSVFVFWPASTNVFRLEQNAALGSTNWTDTTNAVNLVNGTNQVLIVPAARSQFYRLVYP